METCSLKSNFRKDPEKQVRKWLKMFLAGKMTVERTEEELDFASARKEPIVLPVQLSCLCRMPDSGGMMGCDSREETDPHGLTHEKCLRLPFPGLQQEWFMRQMSGLQLQDGFFISPYTYLTEESWVGILNGEEVRTTLKMLQKRVLPVGFPWKHAVPFKQMVEMSDFVSNGGECGEISNDVLSEYVHLLASDREDIKALQAPFMQLPHTELNLNRDNLLGDARPGTNQEQREQEILERWWKTRVDHLRKVVDSQTELMVTVIFEDLSDGENVYFVVCVYPILKLLLL